MVPERRNVRVPAETAHCEGFRAALDRASEPRRSLLSNVAIDRRAHDMLADHTRLTVLSRSFR
jgi:hypothetical protein